MFKLGWLEIILLPVGVVFIFSVYLVSAIRRVNHKLQHAKPPTLWTYLNELGGYVVLGAGILLWLLVSFIIAMFSL